MVFSGDFRALTPFWMKRLCVTMVACPVKVKCSTPWPSQGPEIPAFLPT